MNFADLHMWTCIKLLLLGCLFINPAAAIDGEYEIPYTDTYGYTYDPETGEYVKQEQPPPESRPSSSTQHAATNQQQTAAPKETQIDVADEAGTVSQSTSTARPAMILGIGLAILLGLCIYIFLSRQRKNMISTDNA